MAKFRDKARHKKEVLNFVSVMERMGWSFDEFRACPLPTFIEIISALESLDKEAKKQAKK